MHEKTSLLAETSIRLGLLRPNESKTKVMKINAKLKQPIKIKDTNLEEVKECTYLGSIVYNEGGTDADVKNRLISHSVKSAILFGGGNFRVCRNPIIYRDRVYR
jgi:hypothetical protein